MLDGGKLKRHAHRFYILTENKAHARNRQAIMLSCTWNLSFCDGFICDWNQLWQNTRKTKAPFVANSQHVQASGLRYCYN